MAADVLGLAITLFAAATDSLGGEIMRTDQCECGKMTVTVQVDATLKQGVNSGLDPVFLQRFWSYAGVGVVFHWDTTSHRHKHPDGKCGGGSSGSCCEEVFWQQYVGDDPASMHGDGDPAGLYNLGWNGVLLGTDLVDYPGRSWPWESPDFMPNSHQYFQSSLWCAQGDELLYTLTWDVDIDATYWNSSLTVTLNLAGHCGN